MASRLVTEASGLLVGDWSGDRCRARPFVMLCIYRLCQHGAGRARRLQSVPVSADARPRTSPHSSVYFLNRPLFGLASVGTEYLRKRGRKSVENKGKGKKLCDRDCLSLFLITAELHSTWRHQIWPSRLLGRPDRGEEDW